MVIYHRVDEHEPISSGHEGSIKEYGLEISGPDAGWYGDKCVNRPFH